MSPFASMMTPEPICSPCAVVTVSSTTDGSIFAMAASCAVSRLALLDDVDVEVAVDVAFDGVVALLLLFENSQPENRPTPNMRARTSERSTIAPARPGRLRGGVGGPATGSGG